MDSDLARVFSRDDDLYDPEAGAVDVTPPNKTAGVGAARLNDPPEHDGPEIEAEAEQAPAPKTAAKPKAKAAEPEEPPPHDGQEYEGDPI